MPSHDERGHVMINVGGRITELRQSPTETDEEFFKRAKLVLDLLVDLEKKRATDD